MSTTTTGTPVLSSATVEDWILVLLPILSGPTGSAIINLTGLVPGVGGFLLSVVLASLAKSAIGIGQDKKSYEDWLMLLINFVGLVGAGLSANSEFALVGVILGFAAKALYSLQNGLNAEDAFLAVGAFLALLGAIIPGTQGAAVTNIGLLIGIVLKALPSIGTGGLAGLPAAAKPSGA